MPEMIVQFLKDNKIDFEPRSIDANLIKIDVGVYGDCYDAEIHLEPDCDRIEISFYDFEAMNTIAGIVDVFKKADNYTVSYGTRLYGEMFICLEVF